MKLSIGTDDGLWEFEDTCRRLGLAGERVHHLALGTGMPLAAVPHEGLYALGGGSERKLWTGDARSWAIGPDGALYVGMEPAMVYRSDDGGESWRRLDAIDRLPSRPTWTFPPPPHEPHVLSIDFLPDEPASVLVGIEVGGVIVSRDRGESWEERLDGLYIDVHSVRPDPGAPGRLFAVTGSGFYVSEDDGARWEPRMSGLSSGLRCRSRGPRRPGGGAARGGG